MLHISMQLIGFNFTKIHAEKFPDFKLSGMNTHIEFTNVEKEDVPFIKDAETYKLSFNYTLTYGENSQEKEKKKSKIYGEISFQGVVLAKMEKDESKDLLKFWKKKQLLPQMVMPLYNFILKRCSAKAFILEEDVNLPFHLQIPQLKNQPKSPD